MINVVEKPQKIVEVLRARKKDWSNQFAMVDEETMKVEYIGYGGANPSMNNEPGYMEVDCDEKFLGHECLHVKGVCWFNPWAAVTSVPIKSDSASVNVYVYHKYLEEFNVHSDLHVYICEMAEGTENDQEWKEVSVVSWPLEGTRESESHLRQIVARIDLDEEYQGKKIGVKLQVIG